MNGICTCLRDKLTVGQSSLSFSHQCHDEFPPRLLAFGFDELVLFFVFEGLVNDFHTYLQISKYLKLSKTLNGADEEGRVSQDLCSFSFLLGVRRFFFEEDFLAGWSFLCEGWLWLRVPVCSRRGRAAFWYAFSASRGA